MIISNFSASHTNCWTTLNTKLDCTFFQVFRFSSKACIFSSGHGLCVPVLFIHKHLVKAYIFFFWRRSNKNTPVFQPTVTLHLLFSLFKPHIKWVSALMATFFTKLSLSKAGKGTLYQLTLMCLMLSSDQIQSEIFTSQLYRKIISKKQIGTNLSQVMQMKSFLHRVNSVSPLSQFVSS